MRDWQEAKTLIYEASRIGLYTHINADGDCIGSCFALAHFLKSLGKTVTVYMEEQPFKKLSHIYTCDIPYIVYAEGEIYAKDDLSVAVDTSDEKRVGSRICMFRTSARSLRIDHHISDTTFTDVTYCDTLWAAAAEGIWELLLYLGFDTHLAEERKSDLDVTICTCIYAAIISDTGNFAYTNVTVNTMKIALDTVKIAGNMSWQYDRLIAYKTKSAIKILSKAYSLIEYYDEGRIAFLQLTAEDYAEVGAKEEDTESLPSLLRDIEGVHVSIFIKPCKNRNIRASLRSDEYADVAAIAREFGGGGHKRASGISFPECSDHNEIKANIIAAAIKAIN